MEDTRVIFAFSWSSGMVSAPQLHMVERTLLRVRFTLSLRLPALREREDGSADYMEENILGKPSREIIRTVILGWYNEEIDREILSGFVYEGMPVWLSSENQFNYKAAHDLAVQNGGATLPVTFKFGTKVTWT